MPQQRRWHYLLLLLSSLSLALAATPTTFCKCTCFTNSTIIPFSSSIPTDTTNNTSSTPRTCNDCTKQFCLSQSLAICERPTGEKATEDEVFTLCFQRDSAKDEAVIFVFIFATVGLLAWAAVKPWVLRWRERGRGRVAYGPVSGVGEGRGDGQ